jgi:hypothetical protein
MDTPFVFGRIAENDEFTNREADLEQLVTNFTSGINTVLISPRRWGKSSLVKKASRVISRKNKKVIFCSIDLFNSRNEEQFYQMLAQELIRVSSTRWQERIENTKTFFSRFIPKITYSPDPATDFSIGLDWKEVKKHPDEIIDLAEKIAIKKNVRLVVCIDEFQNIGEYNQPLDFQKKLRSHWQKHQHVSYCLYGSKRQMMLNVFASPSMPFFKFGDLVFLQKIKLEKWIPFIVKRFSDTGKKITPNHASLIAQLAETHPYYVQQLAQQAWLRSGRSCKEENVYQAFESLLLQLSLLFQNTTDTLTSTQINFLRALIEQAEKLSSKETMENYRLGTSANVLRAKEALINKEIIDIEDKEIDFLDPMYKAWLKKHYFGNTL